MVSGSLLTTGFSLDELLGRRSASEEQQRKTVHVCPSGTAHDQGVVDGQRNVWSGLGDDAHFRDEWTRPLAASGCFLGGITSFL